MERVNELHFAARGLFLSFFFFVLSVHCCAVTKRRHANCDRHHKILCPPVNFGRRPAKFA